jgi:O-acetyl-ADP-ribose deacetylase (regulator of RNase III)
MRVSIASMTANLRIVRSDITTLQVDAIVNAANETLLGGGGVDGAIHRAAGPRLLAACRALPQVRPNIRCPTGEARLTDGFRLPAKHVIHTVGPVWHGGSRNEAGLLTSCYRESLKLAAENSLRTIAFSAISCGVYGYPHEAAAKIAIAESRRFVVNTDDVDEIFFVCFSEEIERAYRDALRN